MVTKNLFIKPNILDFMIETVKITLSKFFIEFLIIEYRKDKC